MEDKDWKGNKRTVFTSMGASNHSHLERAEHDFYATEPRALELLLELEKFNNNVWECACGLGHLSEVLIKKGYNVISSDLIDRGYGKGEIDFLQCNKQWSGDIITNPPYKVYDSFVLKALELLNTGNRLALFMPIRYLEGKNRRKNIYEKHPPKIIYMSSGRLDCCRNGDFTNNGGAMSYCWIIWEKGFKGDTVLKWFN